MCGIAGVIGRKVDAVQQTALRLTAAQRHRGPDDSGDWLSPFGEGVLALGHRRLSILDLTCVGHQPMVDPASGNVIVFNGEIYNFKALRQELEAAGEQFSGTGDSEVLLRALTRWGTRALLKLQGMYAFAYYDAREQSVLLARDPLGIKPLYVANTADGLLFASEVRALLASDQVSRTLDLAGVASLLAYGAVQQPATLFTNIRSFPPGSYQVFHAHGNGSAMAPQRFWEFPDVDDSISQNDAVEIVRRTVDDAVRDHLVADVPVGVFLSSGLDSTVIAALSSRYTSRLRSFTVGFSDQPDMSELELASETANQFGLEHSEIRIEGTDAEAALTEWFTALDQPSIDGLNVYVISKAVRAQGITVALSGQGGDELFGGYPSFRDVPRLHRCLRPIAWLPRRVRAAACQIFAGSRPRYAKQKLHDMLCSDGSVTSLCLQRRRAMSASQLALLGITPTSAGVDENFLPPGALAGMRLGPDLIANVSQIEARFYQANMLLRDGDVNGMAHSLEIRVPLLDQRVVDAVAAMPGRVRLPSGRANKHLLRVAFAQHLRPALLNQAKRGFSLPISRWMVGPLRGLCEESLAALKQSGVLHPEGVDAMWMAFLRDPTSPIWSRAFALCVLGRYLRNWS